MEVRTARVDQLGELDDPPAALAVDHGHWLATWAESTGQPQEVVDTAGAVLARVQAEQAFAVVTHGGEAAVARGVLYGGWLGVDHLAAGPALRTPAAGRALLTTLGRWAADNGAEQAYCPVDSAGPARALVAAAGWRRAYAYRFRVHPLPPRLVPR